MYCGERGTGAVGHAAAFVMPTQTDQDTELDADYKMRGICTEQEMSFPFKLRRMVAAGTRTAAVISLKLQLGPQPPLAPGKARQQVPASPGSCYYRCSCAL